MSFFIPTAAAGNGLTLATFGRSGELMGFFYPRIDFAQNVREGMTAIRFTGRPEGGRFCWCFEECWQTEQAFEPTSNVLLTRLVHRHVSLTVEIADCLPPGEHAWVRQVAVSRGNDVDAVQFMHYFRLALGDVMTRNGVQGYPDDNLIVQHFRNVAIAVTANTPFQSQCGSWKPNEESPVKHAMRAGQVGGIRQAIGRVDFAMAFEPSLNNRWQTMMVLAAGPNRETAIDNAKKLAHIPFEQHVRAANDRVAAELADAGRCPIPELTSGFDRAVISLYDLYDQTEGTFLAAPEFDSGYEMSGGYGYCWLRDAAVCALAMQQLGRPALARRFFDWAARTQLPDGHWFQRYWVDGSAASAWCIHEGEIQLDQTCALVYAAGVFARNLDDKAQAFIERYRPVVRQATEAILRYVGDDGLHRPATDLWENSVGTFAYTQAAVIAAMKEADEVFGFDPDRIGPAVREHLRQQLFSRFWKPQQGRWLRRITPDGKEDATLDSSALGLIEPFGILDLHDPAERELARMTIESISQNLRSDVKNGRAVLRFEGEAYMGGGPGCVNTLWLALCRLRLAQSATDPHERQQQSQWALDDIRLVLANTNPVGQLPELLPKISFEYWAAPHAWACSLLIEAVLTLDAMKCESIGLFSNERARIRRQAPLSP